MQINSSILQRSARFKTLTYRRKQLKLLLNCEVLKYIPKWNYTMNYNCFFPLSDIPSIVPLALSLGRLSSVRREPFK